MSLLDRMQKAKAKGVKSTVASKSKTLTDVEFFPTAVPMLNLALSGDIDGGLMSGYTMIAGPSKHYKSNLTLLCVDAVMTKHKDTIGIFYDCEYGSSLDYFKSAGVNPDNILHVEISNIEDLKFDIMKKLNEAKRDDHLVFFIDSIGSLASKKETDDAENEKSVADMTRAKALKSLFRMVTPYLKAKNIPLIGINHIYKTQDLYPKDVVSGGTGPTLAADTIIIIGRQQVKDGTEIVGYDFILNMEKSRFVREKSKIPLNVTFEENVNIYSGLLEVALAGNFVVAPKQGWYSRPTVKDDKNWRKKELNSSEEFWTPILDDPEFKSFVNNLYALKQTESTIIDFDPLTGEVKEQE